MLTLFTEYILPASQLTRDRLAIQTRDLIG
jgi:hypothetical protein